MDRSSSTPIIRLSKQPLTDPDTNILRSQVLEQPTWQASWALSAFKVSVAGSVIQALTYLKGDYQCASSVEHRAGLGHALRPQQQGGYAQG